MMEAKLVISADDKTGAAFSEIERKIKNLSAVGSQVRSISGSVSRMAEGIGSAAPALAQANAQVGRLSQAVASMGRVAGAGAMIAAPVLAMEAKNFSQAVIHTYREFDNIRRYQKAILGLSDSEQKPFVDQAIHMGATTRFNDLQVLHAQLDLAQRGVKKDFIQPFVQEGANYAGAMDTDLPSAVKTLEGIIFSTGKHIEDAGEAFKVMKHAVDFSVKLAKSGGMDNEDISALYKYGGLPGSLAGLSDPTFGAMAALMRRANIRGDESGVAIRAISSSLVSPTNKGLMAMEAAGVHYNQFSRMPGGLSTANLQAALSRKLGIKFTAGDTAALDAITGDPDLVTDQDKFVPAIVDALKEKFITQKGKVSAQGSERIAKAAASFFKMSIESIDVEGLLRALMRSHLNLSQANAIFGPKQGGRAMAALGNEALFNEKYEELKHVPEGFAASISEQRMAGFDGAMQRLEGALKNVETAFGRANDSPMTLLADSAAKAAQHLAEADASLLRFITVVGGAAIAVMSFESAVKVAAAIQTAAGGGGGLIGGLAASSGARMALLGKLGAAGAGIYGFSAIMDGLAKQGRPWGAGPMDESQSLVGLRNELGQVENQIGLKANSPGEIGSLQMRAAQLRQMIGSRENLDTFAASGAGSVPSGLSDFGFGFHGAPARAVSPGLLSFDAAGPRGVANKLEGSASIDITVKVEATSVFMQAFEEMRKVTANGALRTNNGLSMPEAAPTGGSGGM